MSAAMNPLCIPERTCLPRAEFYGQNEIYELARDPVELTRVLDRSCPKTLRSGPASTWRAAG